MTVYIDSSVLLRIVLGQAHKLKEWNNIERGIASALAEVECLHTLDRLRLAYGIGDEEIAVRRETIFRLLEAMEIVELSRPILARAAEPFPTSLGTLDAIHLATALLWREQAASDLTMATHDGSLGTAAKACGLRVIGLRV